MIWTAFPQLSHSIHPSVSSKLRDSFIAPQIGHFTSTEFNQNISHQLRKFVLESLYYVTSYTLNLEALQFYDLSRITRFILVSKDKALFVVVEANVPF